MSNRCDIETNKGVRYTDEFELKDENDGVYPLAGKLVTCHVYPGHPSKPLPPPIVTCDTTDGLTVNTTTGTINRILSSTKLDTLPVGLYWYELIVFADLTTADPIDRPVWGFISHEPTGVGA
jgi:hypothetical protein